MPNNKLAGEEGEIAFILHAIRRGFQCSKPTGDNSKYDVVLDAGSRLYRVQVKSATRESNRGKFILTVTNSRAHRRYTAGDIDILAAYIVPHDLWYIFPIDAVSEVKSISLRPMADNLSKYAKYEEAWFQFTNEPPTALAESV